jgi:hypothetical protein
VKNYGLWKEMSSFAASCHGPHGFGLYQNNVMPGLLFCMERKYVNNCSCFFFLMERTACA